MTDEPYSLRLHVETPKEAEAMLPVIKAVFPTNPITDLVGVQPIQAKFIPQFYPEGR